MSEILHEIEFTQNEGESLKKKIVGAPLSVAAGDFVL